MSYCARCCASPRALSSFRACDGMCPGKPCLWIQRPALSPGRHPRAEYAPPGLLIFRCNVDWLCPAHPPSDSVRHSNVREKLRLVRVSVYVAFTACHNRRLLTALRLILSPSGTISDPDRDCPAFVTTQAQSVPVPPCQRGDQTSQY